MKVGHVVSSISGTSIPVEIATKIDEDTDATSRIISVEPIDQIPDTVDSDIVLTGLSAGLQYRELCEELAALGFDIVHTHHNRPAAKIGLLSRRYGLNHVNTQHGHIHYTVPQKMLNGVTLATSGGIIYNSASTRDSYNRIERTLKGGASEHLCYNGVDIERVEPYVTEINEVELAVTACRLIERKNLASLIRALEYTDVDLRIIGTGPQREALEQLASTIDGGSRIEFLGYIEDRADVYAELARGDVYVLPSHEEGFGVSLAEAMALSIPPVVSDIPVFHELVGDAGVFVDKDSPRNIASGIEGLRSNPEYARQFSERSRRRIREDFTLGQTANCYERVYEQILGNHEKDASAV